MSVSARTVPVHPMTAWGELKYRSIHSQLQHQVEESSYDSRTVRFTPREAAPATHWTESWKSPRDSLDALENRQISWVWRIWTCNSSVVQPLTQSLQWLSYPGSYSISTSFYFLHFNPLNAELHPIYHLLALLGAHHILHVSRVRVKLQLSSAFIRALFLPRHLLLCFPPKN